MKSLTAILAPPLLCAGILGGIVLEKRTHVQPADAVPYHKRAYDAINAMPWAIGDQDNGSWVGKEIVQPTAAVRLLRPNIIISRRYTDATQKGYGVATRECDVLIVQCKDSRDMVGHYPVNCYPNAGETLIRSVPRDWPVGNVTITGTEYTFERFNRGQSTRRVIYNFLVVPGVGIVRDIKGVDKAAEDYQRRHFGAAQFQFVMSDEHSVEVRDRIFATLMGANLGMLTALSDVKLK
jgi:hypothetical protein